MPTATKERIVKFRLAEFYVSVPDPLDPSKSVLAKRQAIHGQTVSKEESGPDPTVAYGLTDTEERRLENLGAFFTDAEIAARDAGLTDVEGELGDVISTPTFPGIGRDPGASPTEGHPLSFDELPVPQLAEYIRTQEPTADQLAEIVTESQSPQLLADKLIQAESMATDGSPREEVLGLLGAMLGRETVGPEGSEGVAGTEPDETPDGPGGSQEAPSDAAVAYAKEKKIDLATAGIKGSGKGGRITKPDIEKYVKARDES